MQEVALNPQVEQLQTQTDVAKLGQPDPCCALMGTIWIDLDNSPHVPFFAPIIEQLKKSGYDVLLTARSCFQVCGLADLLGLSYQRIGRHYGKNTFWKLFGLGWRALQLMPVVTRNRPVLAVSHGSRSQLLVANLLRIPSVTIADYEFAKIWMGVRPTWVITPEVISDQAIHGQRNHTLKYPGIKEDVYVPNFKPEPGFLANLGLKNTDVIVTVRPPATEAHYHRPETDELFEASLNFLAEQPRVRIVLLPRNERQTLQIRSKWAPLFKTGKALIPEHVVDGLNLIWHSDLVISGGGTMNREAAALGVPVYSVFRGTIGAVDRYLAREGRLELIENASEIPSKLVLAKRNTRTAVVKSRATMSTIVKHLISITEKTYPTHGNRSN